MQSLNSYKQLQPGLFTFYMSMASPQGQDMPSNQPQPIINNNIKNQPSLCLYNSNSNIYSNGRKSKEANSAGYKNRSLGDQDRGDGERIEGRVQRDGVSGGDGEDRMSKFLSHCVGRRCKGGAVGSTGDTKDSQVLNHSITDHKDTVPSSTATSKVPHPPQKPPRTHQPHKLNTQPNNNSNPLKILSPNPVTIQKIKKNKIPVIKLNINQQYSNVCKQRHLINQNHNAHTNSNNSSNISMNTSINKNMGVNAGGDGERWLERENKLRQLLEMEVQSNIRIHSLSVNRKKDNLQNSINNTTIQKTPTVHRSNTDPPRNTEAINPNPKNNKSLHKQLQQSEVVSPNQDEAVTNLSQNPRKRLRQKSKSKQNSILLSNKCKTIQVMCQDNAFRGDQVIQRMKEAMPDHTANVIQDTIHQRQQQIIHKQKSIRNTQTSIPKLPEISPNQNKSKTKGKNKLSIKSLSVNSIYCNSTNKNQNVSTGTQYLQKLQEMYPGLKQGKNPTFLCRINNCYNNYYNPNNIQISNLNLNSRNNRQVQLSRQTKNHSELLKFHYPHPSNEAVPRNTLIFSELGNYRQHLEEHEKRNNRLGNMYSKSGVNGPIEAVERDNYNPLTQTIEKEKYIAEKYYSVDCRQKKALQINFGANCGNSRLIQGWQQRKKALLQKIGDSKPKQKSKSKQKQKENQAHQPNNQHLKLKESLKNSVQKLQLKQKQNQKQKQNSKSKSKSKSKLKLKPKQKSNSLKQSKDQPVSQPPKLYSKIKQSYMNKINKLQLKELRDLR